MISVVVGLSRSVKRIPVSRTPNHKLSGLKLRIESIKHRRTVTCSLKESQVEGVGRCPPMTLSVIVFIVYV